MIKLSKAFLPVFFTGVALHASGQETTKQLPNILLILTDDLGYHDVSYYGTNDIKTPNIDAICKSGIQFNNFYSNSPVCSPTRASLLSGRYPEMVGVPGLIRDNPKDNFGYLKPGTILLPQKLKEAGYNTAIIGKWNLGLEIPNTPTEKGFDYFKGFLSDMMDDYWGHLRNGKNYLRENLKEINPEGHATDLFTQWAVDYINKRQKGQPFFLYLAYTAPHFPVQPPPEWLEKVQKEQPDLPLRRAKLVALIEHMDDGIGKVISTLKQNGQFENTIIIFTSDNGGRLEDGANNGPLRGGKQSVFEGGIRVPACISWPGHIIAGSSTTQKVMSMDLYPTLCEIAGVPIKHKIDGINLLPIITGQVNTLASRPLFFVRREGTIKYGGQTIQAVIMDDWKLLQNSPYEPYELYNLYQDPREENNNVRYEVGKYKELHELLIKQIQRGGSVPWQKPE